MNKYGCWNEDDSLETRYADIILVLVVRPSDIKQNKTCKIGLFSLSNFLNNYELCQDASAQFGTSLPHAVHNF